MESFKYQTYLFRKEHRFLGRNDLQYIKGLEILLEQKAAKNTVLFENEGLTKFLHERALINLKVYYLFIFNTEGDKT